MQWRLITAGAVLVAACGIPRAMGYVQAIAQQQAQDREQVGVDQQLQLSRELPAAPPDVAAALVRFIGSGTAADAASACLMFSGPAAGEFATPAGAPDCVDAIFLLHGQVSDPVRYIADVTIPTAAWATTGDTATVNGCITTWDGLLADPTSTAPGPLPGYLTLSRQDQHGWLITSYQPC